MDDAWVQQELAAELAGSQDDGVDRLVRLERWKASQAKAKIARIQEALEASEPGTPGAYTIEEAASRIDRYRQVIARAEREVQRLEGQRSVGRLSPADVQQLRQRLQSLRERNLVEATFEERLDLVARLDIRVYPSEDLKSRRTTCRLNLGAMAGERGYKGGSAKVLPGVPSVQ